MSDPVAVGVDVGGTKLLGLAVDEDGGVLARRRQTSPRSDAEGLVAAIAAVARELGEGLRVGVGVAGVVSRDGVVRYGPNLDVRDVALRDRLADELDVPVAAYNDATVALYGELRAGTARGARDVVMLTLGTGVGGAMVVDGRLVLGSSGMAGELGHVIVHDGGRRCPCGNLGCLEAYASGTAVGLRGEELLAAEDTPSRLRDVDRVDGKAVTLAAHAGDALARRVVDEAGYWLGVGLTGLVNVFDPELVVIGGGAATTLAPFVIPRAVEIMSERVLGVGHRPLPQVVAATLGDDAGAIGAALLAHGDETAAAADPHGVQQP
ncbi:MAG: ROK family protein [Actinobacteria bacterium]|nr:ROK family protein [Actinomycetota bacterium]